MHKRKEERTKNALKRRVRDVTEWEKKLKAEKNEKLKEIYKAKFQAATLDVQNIKEKFKSSYVAE